MYHYKVKENPVSLGIAMADLLVGQVVVLAHSHRHFMPSEIVRVLWRGSYYYIKGCDLEYIGHAPV